MLLWICFGIWEKHIYIYVYLHICISTYMYIYINTSVNSRGTYLYIIWWESIGNFGRRGHFIVKKIRHPMNTPWMNYRMLRFYYILLWISRIWDLTWETFSRSNNSGIVSHTTTWECNVGMEESIWSSQKWMVLIRKNTSLPAFCGLTHGFTGFKRGSNIRSVDPPNLKEVCDHQTWTRLPLVTQKFQEVKTPVALNRAGYRFFLITYPWWTYPQILSCQPWQVVACFERCCSSANCSAEAKWPTCCNAACGSGAATIYANFDSEDIGNNRGTW